MGLASQDRSTTPTCRPTPRRSISPACPSSPPSLARTKSITRRAIRRTCINYRGQHDITRLHGADRALAGDDRRNHRLTTSRSKQTQTQGRVGNVFLGTIPDYASENVKGVKISGVVQGGPAAKAGLLGGDTIVGLGGATLENIYDYMQAMNGLKVGQEIGVVVERGGKKLNLKLTPTVRE